MSEEPLVFRVSVKKDGDTPWVKNLHTHTRRHTSDTLASITHTRLPKLSNVRDAIECV